MRGMLGGFEKLTLSSCLALGGPLLIVAMYCVFMVLTRKSYNNDSCSQCCLLIPTEWINMIRSRDYYSEGVRVGNITTCVN